MRADSVLSVVKTGCGWRLTSVALTRFIPLLSLVTLSCRNDIICNDHCPHHRLPLRPAPDRLGLGLGGVRCGEEHYQRWTGLLREATARQVRSSRGQRRSRQRQEEGQEEEEEGAAADWSERGGCQQRLHTPSDSCCLVSVADVDSECFFFYVTSPEMKPQVAKSRLWLLVCFRFNAASVVVQQALFKNSRKSPTVYKVEAVGVICLFCRSGNVKLQCVLIS